VIHSHNKHKARNIHDAPAPRCELRELLLLPALKVDVSVSTHKLKSPAVATQKLRLVVKQNTSARWYQWSGAAQCQALAMQQRRSSPRMAGHSCRTPQYLGGHQWLDAMSCPASHGAPVPILPLRASPRRSTWVLRYSQGGGTIREKELVTHSRQMASTYGRHRSCAQTRWLRCC
jgi:hypothetical protein